MKDNEKRNAYAREWRKNNAEKLREQAKARYLANPEKYKKKTREYVLNYIKNNPNANRNKHYKKRYGITVEQYEEMAAAQEYLCAICQLPESKKRKDGTTSILAVDHDHITGAIRKLLCAGCNHMLGNIENKKIPMHRIESYLMEFPKDLA